ncbi:MAG: L-2-hydroxyglutarate oxidase [Acidobacteria bacterium]|nr:L-2-hydroxyglutarate oxidase [Acidobacteriota bacterium]
MEGCEVLVVGAGITGLAIARELCARGAGDVRILEKEPELGAHASGRNSGVLHAGIYYTPDTLKARYCVEGNRLMKEYCRARGLTLVECGKVIVARDASDLPALDDLKRRADAAGARASFVTPGELAEIEPHAATFERALHSPDTAVIRPKEILESLARDLVASGRARIRFGVALSGVSGGVARTTAGPVRYERLVNAAGAHADRVARLFGVGREYRVLPFKGTYRRLRPGRTDLCRGCIYPVPDLRTPFLGVHFTRGADGVVHLGPTAVPALGRESYRGAEGLGLESLEILAREARLLATDPVFRSAALDEPRRWVRRSFLAEARRLVPSLAPGDLARSSKVGIRPQLVHLPTRRLEMDFVLVREGPTLHVLNAISPAFTSSMAFARRAVDVMEGA